MFILVTGAASSGKSEYAEDLVCSMEAGKRIYIATMERKSYNLTKINRHKSLRSGKGFETIEISKDLSSVQKNRIKGSTILLEDIPNLLANELFYERKSITGHNTFISETAERIINDILFLSSSSKNLIAVTGDLTSGGYDHDPDTLSYLETFGFINRSLAKASDALIEVVCKIPCIIKGEI
ncbi:MAG: bifunctional adenosylcobinamide kinase/adenosylcobinamide-phosphate guanylyltransferase [Lachnospiraceae bacterium]|nr:bifunctional adenosylcobinamide kinase/adenosylcobinamide-phosphate guanylyltransferase [Lachnospiraceae bacterium]